MCVLGRGVSQGKFGGKRNVLVSGKKNRSFCQVPSSCLSRPFLFSVFQPGPMAGGPQLQSNLI